MERSDLDAPDFGFGANPSLARAGGPTTLQGEDGAAASGPESGASRPVLRGYQEQAVTFLNERTRAIEGDAPGIGKTATVISALASRTPQPSPVLVLAPLSVVRHWEAEIARWSGYSVSVGVGSAPRRWEARAFADGLKGVGGHIYVTNYEAARADIENLMSVPWEAAVCDEVHRLRNRQTRTFKTLRPLILRTPSFIGISGTPVVNGADDLWTLLHLIDPKRWRAYWRWVDEFMESTTTTFNGKLAQPIRQITGMRPGMDGVLRQQLRDVMIRRSLNELLPELPEVSETIYEVDLSPEEKMAYKNLEKKFWADMPDGTKVIAPNDVAKITRLRQMATDWSVLGATEGNSTKLKRLYELLDDIGDEQVVIFSAFSSVIDTVAAHLNAGKITGDVKSNDRTDVIRAFKEGNLRYICGTIGAMGEGIDLQTANHCVFLDLWWSPASNEQAIARVHRYGQRADTVFVHTIAARGTIDAYVAKTLAAKQDIIQSLVGLAWNEVLGGKGGAHGT